MMQEYSRALGDAVKRARSELGSTQSQVADKIGADARTVMNIENYKGNPTMEVLFPLIRTLKIDAREIFNPELPREGAAASQMRCIIGGCSEREVRALIPIVEAVLSALRTTETEETAYAVPTAHLCAQDGQVI